MKIPEGKLEKYLRMLGYLVGLRKDIQLKEPIKSIKDQKTLKELYRLAKRKMAIDEFSKAVASALNEQPQAKWQLRTKRFPLSFLFSTLYFCLILTYSFA